MGPQSNSARGPIAEAALAAARADLAGHAQVGHRPGSKGRPADLPPAPSAKLDLRDMKVGAVPGLSPPNAFKPKKSALNHALSVNHKQKLQQQMHASTLPSSPSLPLSRSTPSSPSQLPDRVIRQLSAERRGWSDGTHASSSSGTPHASKVVASTASRFTYNGMQDTQVHAPSPSPSDRSKHSLASSPCRESNVAPIVSKAPTASSNLTGGARSARCAASKAPAHVGGAKAGAASHSTAPALHIAHEKAGTAAGGWSLSVEASIDDCVASINQLSEGGGGSMSASSASVQLLQAIHRLNGSLMMANSFEHAVELAERSVSCSSSSGGGGRGGGDTSCNTLIVKLLQLQISGEPSSLLASCCLKYLASSSKALNLFGSAGLMPLLIGQLRCGRSLEPPLLLSALSLLAAVVGSDAQHEHRPLLAANMKGVLTVALLFLSHEAVACRQLSLKLLEEVLLTKKGRDLISASAPTRESLIKASQSELDVPLKQSLGKTLKLAMVLCSNL